MHACTCIVGVNSEAALDITQDNFETALYGFTPASIRNVPLHQAGELGWDDIGGLTDVKNTLIETLQWPTKVCKFVKFLLLNSQTLKTSANKIIQIKQLTTVKPRKFKL